MKTKGLLLVVLVTAGGGVVDPRGDYDATLSHAEGVTGVKSSWRPELEVDAIEAAARLAEILNDGLTEQEALKLALLNSGSMHAALYEVGIARADVVQAGLWSNPTIGLALRFPIDGGVKTLEGLPAEARAYIKRMEQLCDVPVDMISTGPDREETIVLRHPFA